MNPPCGRVYWAVAPYSPVPPFRLYAGQGSKPFKVDAPHHLVKAAVMGESEFTLLAPAKVRPVLVLTEVLAPYDEVLCARLQRLETLSDDEAHRVREHDDPSLFLLSPSSFPGLAVENAVIVSSLIRVAIAALDTTHELGTLNDNELRVVHERIVRAQGLRLELLVLDKARELVKQLRAGQ